MPYYYIDDVSVIAEIPNAINNISSSLTISPNPFTTQTTITLNNLSQDFTVKLFDAYGRKADADFHFTSQQNKTVLTLHRGNLTPGVYFFSVVSKERREVRELVVE